MENTESIFIQHRNHTYKVVAAAAVVPGSEPHPHAGEWEVKVTIYRTSDADTTKSKSLHDVPQYAPTKDEAIRKGHDYGRKLVVREIEGLGF
jgi:hypothetical protein